MTTALSHLQNRQINESAELVTSPAPKCSWCDSEFRSRQDGGKVQRFCRPACRQAFHRALRDWAWDQWRSGELTTAALRRSVSPPADENGGTQDTPIVRENLWTPSPSDGADDADANIREQSGGWRVRL